MFRFFENLIDPYMSYAQNDTPPRKLWPFLRDYLHAFRFVFAVTAVLSVLNAVMDVGLLWYLGRMVDLLGQGKPQQVWATALTEAREELEASSGLGSLDRLDAVGATIEGEASDARR